MIFNGQTAAIKPKTHQQQITVETEQTWNDEKWWTKEENKMKEKKNIQNEKRKRRK